MATMPHDIPHLGREVLMAVVDALPVAALYIEGDTICFNRAAERLTGYERAELQSLDEWFRKLYGPDHETVRGYYEADWAAGFPEPRRVAITTKGGGLRHVEFAAAGSERVICIMHDITGLVVAQEQLRESEERYRHFSSITTDYVYSCSRRGTDPFRVRWLGGAIEKITGYSEQEIHTKGCWLSFVHPDDQERLSAHLMGLRPGDTGTEEFRLIRKDGDIRWIREICRCGRGDAPDELRLFGTSQDITERKEAEEALRQLNEALDRRVAERTTQLREAYREQESFSYSVSHDLRAPLRHINSYSTILMEDFGNQIPVEAHGHLERIATASRHMGQLIDDLLELSRVGRAELHKSTINLSKTAAMVASMLRENEPNRTVELVIADGLTARADKTLVRQALLNLLGNALKYTAREPHARIEFGGTVVDGQDAFYVRDNGVGFDMAYADKLFRTFQRLHGSAEFEGTGVGLATVRRIIERHGGRTWAEGKVNGGATFYFTLPAGEQISLTEA